MEPEGTVILKSTYAGNLQLDASALVVDEITLIGSRCGPFAPALQLLAGGKIDVRPLLEARYPRDEGLETFAHASRSGTLEVLLEMA